MAQFDVYENPESESKDVIPFLVDVQHELHTNLATRTIIPLVNIFSAKDEARKLCPRFEVLGKHVLLSTPEITGYPVRELGSRVSTLTDKRSEIMDAIDFLLHGF